MYIGGGVAYVSGQIEPIIPALNWLIGGLAKATTPIWLLYRTLLGSAFANIGARQRVVISHNVAALELRIVGKVDGGEVLLPYVLKTVVRLKLGLIQVLVALLPCRNEYGYQEPLGDWYSISTWN